MDIKSLKVRNFRGINCLDWNVAGRFVCLIGPGDSTKSTIIEAIELALTSRRNVSFDDADFYNADTNNPIFIEVTVGGSPLDLLSEAKFGYLVRGWDSKTGVRDEPQDDEEPVLTIQLNIDKTLEPIWLIVNDRHPEGKRISAFDRAKFGVSRIGDYVDWQFSWGQGSALTRLMEEREDFRLLLADARRQAKASLDPEKFPLLKQSAKNAETIGKKLGVAAKSKTGFVPHLDVRNVSLGASILALHDGPIPLRQSGLGTSRLLTMGLQHEAGRKGGIMLIDEVENGLEPHRVRRLLHVLRTGTYLQGSDEEENADKNTSAYETATQVFLTTHSPVSLCELEPINMRVVRSENGVTNIKRPDDVLRPLLRTNPDAFLARKVIVCEGKTEIGFCRALDKWWSETGHPFAYVGAALADGQGNTKGPSAAMSFANLGYRTAFFGDSDKPLNPDETALKGFGICTFIWADGMSIEERIAIDLPWDGFVDMVRLVLDDFDESHVKAKLAPQFKCELNDLPVDPEKWKLLLSDEVAIRIAFAKAAKAEKAGWFKRVDRAEKLGKLVVRHWHAFVEKPLGAGITQLKSWVYD
jgi:putative ATP-dependent endonuclease of the OLD family